MRTSKYFFALAGLLIAASCFALQAAVPPTSPAAMVYATKVIALAGSISVVIQGLKKLLPGMSGHLAQIINGIGAVAGSLALSSPGQWKTLDFWAQVALTFGAAAGVHDLASFWGLFKQGK